MEQLVSHHKLKASGWEIDESDKRGLEQQKVLSTLATAISSNQQLSKMIVAAITNGGNKATTAVNIVVPQELISSITQLINASRSSKQWKFSIVRDKDMFITEIHAQQIG
jgi:hypothetical protein